MRFGIHRQIMAMPKSYILVVYRNSICVKFNFLFYVGVVRLLLNGVCWIPNEACDLSKIWQIIIVSLRVELIKST